MAVACLAHRLIAEGERRGRPGPGRPGSSPRHPSPRREPRRTRPAVPGWRRTSPAAVTGHRRRRVRGGRRPVPLRPRHGPGRRRRWAWWPSSPAPSSRGPVSRPPASDRRPRRRRRPPLRRRVHPVAWFAPVVGSVVAMLAWAGVAHSSGSGWVQAVGALLAAVLFTGLVAPLFPARRAAVTCTASPVRRPRPDRP